MRPILALGVSLFEVLVSLLLLSLVLLGLEVMQVSALHLNINACLVTVAEQQLQNIEERLRLLGPSGPYDQQLAAWNQENQRVLPQGWGAVSGSYPNYTLTLYWGKKQDQSCEKSREEHAGCLSENFNL